MESRPPSTESGHAEAGERLAEISRRVVQLHKEHYGKGPTKARTFIDGDVVVCLLEGGYLSAERTLVAHGRGRMVSEGRAALQTVLRQAFMEVVETALNRRVSSFMSATDDDLELSVEVFVLEAADETGHDISSVPISAE